jgi:ADP-ribosylglycohydrolase
VNCSSGPLGIRLATEGQGPTPAAICRGGPQLDKKWRTNRTQDCDSEEEDESGAGMTPDFDPVIEIGADVDETFPALGGEAGEQIRRSFLLYGMDALGWYVSFHVVKVQWGIYIPVTGIAYLIKNALSKLTATLDAKANLGSEWVEDYRQWHGWKSGPKGTITDDTQFSIWLLQSLIANGGVEPHDLVHRFTAEKIRGIGKATRDFVRNVKVLGKPWFESGVVSAGNGVAMRSAPIGLFYREHSKALKLGSILQAVVTHNDSMAVAGGILTAYAIALLLAMQPSDLVPLVARQDFCRRLAKVIRGLEATGAYRTRNTEEPGTLEQRFRHDLPRWLEQNLDPIEINNHYWSGAYVLESLPQAFYCFLRSPEDFRETLLQAVNSSRDADTVAAIACNLSGTLNGARAIPQPYLDDLEFRQDLEHLAQSLLP